MIHVNRVQKDGNGKYIAPDDIWFKKAEEATLKEPPSSDYEFSAGIYRDDEVVKALAQLFRNKCAYCESRLPETGWDVDHFRPKKAVKENPNHPGYYWLGYTWANLFPSRVPCNQIRRDRPTWEQPESGRTGGKSTHFPLVDEKTRAWKPEDRLDQEMRLLLDPCTDIPERHLKVSIAGNVEAQLINGAPDLRGERSVEVFHLERKALVNNIRIRIQAVCEFLELWGLVPDEISSKNGQLIDSFFGAGAEYTMATRSVLHHPNEFGLKLALSHEIHQSLKEKYPLNE